MLGLHGSECMIDVFFDISFHVVESKLFGCGFGGNAPTVDADCMSETRYILEVRMSVLMHSCVTPLHNEPLEWTCEIVIRCVGWMLIPRKSLNRRRESCKWCICGKSPNQSKVSEHQQPWKKIDKRASTHDWSS